MLSKVFKRTVSLRMPVCSSLRSAVSSFGMQRSAVAMTMMNNRCFSTSAAASKLAKALDKELQYEKENYAQLEDTANFLDESGFDFFEDKEGLNCYLRKEVDGRKVEVQFSARQPPPEPEGDEQQEHEGDMYDESNLCDFSVYIHRPGSEKGLIFDCSTNETEISISNVMFTSEISKMRDTHRFERNFNYYNGPDFSSLDERLQAGLSEFLQGHGIDEHLAAFVEVMSVDKDNRLYMQWLEDMKNFVNP